MGCSWPEIEVSRFKCAWTGPTRPSPKTMRKIARKRPLCAEGKWSPRVGTCPKSAMAHGNLGLYEADEIRISHSNARALSLSVK